MMKKGFYAILAALTVLALVMTGCPGTDGGGGGTPPVVSTRTTINFDVNKEGILAANPAFSNDDINDLDLPSGFEIDKGDPLGPVSRIATNYAADKIVNMGWAAAKNSTVLVTAGETFGQADSVTLYAVWEAYAPVTVTFDLNGGWNNLNPATQTNPTTVVHKTLTIASSTGASMPNYQPYKPGGFEFKEWNAKNDGTGSVFTASSPVSAAAGSPLALTVYAIYAAEPTAEFTLTSKAIPAGGEYIALANGAHAAYEFTIPPSASWSDFDHIEMEVCPTGDFYAENSARTIRLYGSEKITSFGIYKYNQGVANKLNGRFAAVHFGSASNPWIMDTRANWATIHGFLTGTADDMDNRGYTSNEIPANDGGTPDDDSDDTPMVKATAYTKGGVTITAGTDFFPLKLPIDGRNKNDQYDANKMPHPKFNGVLYFGLGISGPSGAATVQKIKNVKLVAKSTSAGVSDVAAKAVYFTYKTEEYAAFFGYDGGKTTVEGEAYDLSDGGSDMNLVYRGETAPPAEAVEPPAPPAAEDLEVLKDSDAPIVNAEAFTGGYDSRHGAIVTFTFPASLNISSYRSITLSVKASTTTDDAFEDVTADSQVQFDFVDIDGKKVGGSQYNIKTAAAAITIPQNIKNVASTVTGINIYNADASIKYVQVLVVTLDK